MEPAALLLPLPPAPGLGLGLRHPHGLIVGACVGFGLVVFPLELLLGLLEHHELVRRHQLLRFPAPQLALQPRILLRHLVVALQHGPQHLLEALNVVRQLLHGGDLADSFVGGGHADS